jgi:5-methyltetrahydrofolate corrinoid/iron sulfur protein methyltransferase
MILIGENIHIISKDVSVAVRDRNAKYIQELAIAQTQAGVHYIDMNLGPCRKNTEETAEWVVKTVEEVSGLPLSIDTLNPVAMEAGLRACTKARPLLNSASGRTDSKDLMMPLAKKYNTDLVLSVFTDTGCPPDVEGRVESVMESAAYANELGIPNEDIWIDPVLLPVSADQGQIVEALEFMKIIGDILPGVKSTIGLSNVSNGTPEELRGILNRTMMVMLGRCGQYSVIADSFDKELIDLNNGDMPGIVELIYKVMDGEDVGQSLSQKERDYVKTVRVLMGETLYSHGWLED